MSDRDEGTGQFAASELLTGRAAEERDAGYVPYKEEPIDDTGDLTVEEAVEQLASSTPPADIKTYSSLDDLPKNVSLTVEQAAKIKSDMDAADSTQAENDEADRLRAEVDKLREASKPKTEDSFEVGKDPQADVEKLLAIPHVKEAVDKLTGEAETARQNHVAAVDAATEMVRATVLGRFPVMAQIANLPQEQQGRAVAAWMQQNPEGAAELAQSMNGLQELVSQQQTHQKTTAERERSEFQTYARAQDEQFSKLMKGENMPAIEAEIPVMLKNLGVDPMEFLKAGNESKFLRSAPAQAILAKAAKYDLLMKAPKALVARNLPPVQRPGVASVSPRSGDDIATLDRRLSQTGSIKDAVALYAAQTRRKG